MISAEFDYRRAASVEEAVRLLAANDGAKLLAGGHSLLPMMKLRLAAPTLLIDVGGIEGLSGIREESEDLVIGATTSHAAIAAAEPVRSACQALAEAAAAIGDVQVRNCGTIGGSLAHADPAADYAAATLALDALVEITGTGGERSLPVADLFDGLLTTTLEHTDLITAVRVPRRGSSAYEKFAQPASGFAIVGVAVRLESDDDGVCTTARLAATGISDRPLRLVAAEAALVGSSLEESARDAAAAAADEGIDDVRADLYAAEDYRRHLLRVLVGRAVARAAA